MGAAVAVTPTSPAAAELADFQPDDSGGSDRDDCLDAAAAAAGADAAEPAAIAAARTAHRVDENAVSSGRHADRFELSAVGELSGSERVGSGEEEDVAAAGVVGGTDVRTPDGRIGEREAAAAPVSRLAHDALSVGRDAFVGCRRPPTSPAITTTAPTTGSPGTVVVPLLAVAADGVAAACTAACGGRVGVACSDGAGATRFSGCASVTAMMSDGRSAYPPINRRGRVRHLYRVRDIGAVRGASRTASAAAGNHEWVPCGRQDRGGTATSASADSIGGHGEVLLVVARASCSAMGVGRVAPVRTAFAADLHRELVVGVHRQRTGHLTARSAPTGVIGVRCLTLAADGLDVDAVGTGRHGVGLRDVTPAREEGQLEVADPGDGGLRPYLHGWPA